MSTNEPPLLVASDIDGTLIDDTERIPKSVREAIIRMTRAGTVMALATGRPARWLRPVLDQLTVRPVCVCTNGAVIYDSARDQILQQHALRPDVMRRIIDAARLVTEVGVAVERCGESAFAPEEELFVVAPSYVHVWDADEYGHADEAEVISKPAVKLLLRNDSLSAPELYALIKPLVPASMAHITYSMNEGLLEVSAPGINKATGVGELANYIGVSAREVLCFGDMPNDLEMLQWAGHGVAMANAHPKLKAVADEVCGSNNDGGIADVLSRWF
ncbi:HAD family hydrolase [Corynebacterium canis]|uniref:HAD family hydrolase n=1 Tax=Corynebacterium canis TaxID=679663 RepID=A0A5C5TV14_9CORY|nr:HAD family hydrolase [Corynebacterium canis]